MIYWISQIIGFIAFIVSLIAYHRKEKKNIFKNMILCNILKLIHYLLLNAYSGCITKLIALFRDCFVLYKEKHPKLSNKIFLIIFIIIYVIAAVFTYDGIFSILPIVAAIFYIVFIWNGDELTIKKAAFFSYFLWLIYNIFVMSIAGIVSSVVSIISTFIAIRNYNNGGKVDG